MEKIKKSITINASKEKVWKKMLDAQSYQEWTKAFHEGSRYEGSWEKGKEIKFLGPDQNGNVQGMYSKIKENIPYQYLSIEHLGIINNGVVDTTSDEVKKWAPSLENYTFSAQGNQTTLTVDMDIDSNYKTMFEEKWRDALALLKKLCEQ